MLRPAWNEGQIGWVNEVERRLRRLEEAVKASLVPCPTCQHVAPVGKDIEVDPQGWMLLR